MMQTQPKFRRRAEARAGEILDAALAVFTERGFDAARMDDIAAAAGVSKGAVYLYFDGKEALLRGLIEREVAPIAAHIEAAAHQGRDDPAGALRAIHAFAATVLSNPRAFQTPRLVLSVAGHFPDIGAYYRERVIEIGLAALTRLFRRGVALGVFRRTDAAAAARALIGPLLVEALRTHHLGATPARDAAKRARESFDILMRGVAA